MTSREEEALRATRLGTALADLGDDDEQASVDVDALKAEVERAWLTVRKQRLRALGDLVKQEAREGKVVQFDRAALRARLQQASSEDLNMPLTLAARGAAGGFDDEDLESLLEDLAELDRDAERSPER